MIVLEFILLLVGLIISVVTIIKTDIEKNPRLKKILAGLYLLVFVISVVVLLTNKSDENQSELKLFKSLGSINDSISIQSDSINLILGRTLELNKKLDSINIKTAEAINQREKSYKEFIKQNQLLNKANELTEKQIIEGKPELEVFTYNVKFSKLDTLNTKLEIAFSNTKERPALNFKHNDLIVFKFKKDKDFEKYALFKSDNVGRKIFKSNPVNVTHTFTIGMDNLIDQFEKGYILTSFSFYDEILDQTVEDIVIITIQLDEKKLIAKMENVEAKSILKRFITDKNIDIKIK